MGYDELSGVEKAERELVRIAVRHNVAQRVGRDMVNLAKAHCGSAGALNDLRSFRSCVNLPSIILERVLCRSVTLIVWLLLPC